MKRKYLYCTTIVTLQVLTQRTITKTNWDFSYCRPLKQQMQMHQPI